MQSPGKQGPSSPSAFLAAAQSLNLSADPDHPVSSLLESVVSSPIRGREELASSIIDEVVQSLDGRASEILAQVEVISAERQRRLQERLEQAQKLQAERMAHEARDQKERDTRTTGKTV